MHVKVGISIFNMCSHLVLFRQVRLGIVPIISLTTWLDDEIQEIPECKMLVEYVLGLHSTKEVSKVPLAHSHPNLFSSRSTCTVSIEGTDIYCPLAITR